MRRFNTEVIVAFFVIAGLCALGYLLVRLGDFRLWGGTMYDLTAVFPSAAGLQSSATVEIAGVKVGWVEKIVLQDYDAMVQLRLENRVQIQEDAIVSIRTRGVLGEKYVLITPGGSERLLRPGERIREVEPPLDIETLIGRFIQGKL